MNPGFNLSPVRVEFLVQKEVHENIFIQVLLLTHISIIPRISHTRSSFSARFVAQTLRIAIVCCLMFMQCADEAWQKLRQHESLLRC
jgi:hypothetical protein